MATIFVSPFGADAGPGTLAQPFRLVEQGVAAIGAPGDILFIRGGSYAEDVTVAGKHGTSSAPILIRAYGREHVTIDGENPVDIDGDVSKFRIGGNAEWIPAKDEDPDAHDEEFLSCRRFPIGPGSSPVRQGAFIDREPYTRLITYTRLEDLRADNQTFGRLPLCHELPGPLVVDINGDPVTFKQPGGAVVHEFKHPWVYMGPGLFFDDDGRIHIRLSHTTNNVPGVVDYDGGTDPRQLRLAISHGEPAPLRVENCEFVHFDHLDIRFGGERTLAVAGSTGVVFDHMRFLAGQAGIRVLGHNDGLVFRHCEVRAGVPPWMFRSDIKDEYRFMDGADNVRNRLGHGTSQAVFGGAPTNTGTEVHHCEFVDGHDLGLFGQRTRFHHNLIDNLHDDGLIVDFKDTSELEVAHNVILRCVQVLGFALRKPENLGGDRKVHRNLIDLRSPTNSIRPRPDGHLIKNDEENQDGSVFRYGQIYKGNSPDGPLDLFHNTCLVAQQTSQAGIQHYSGAKPTDKTRRSFNNVFIDVDPAEAAPAGHATAFLPPPDFRGPTDGNCYFSLAGASHPLLRHRGYDFGADHRVADSFLSLDDYHQGFGQTEGAQPNLHFEHSKAIYSPGFEKHGTDKDPAFVQIAPDGVPQFDDDLRPQIGSPLIGGGVDLSDAEVGIEDPEAPAGPPDRGCYDADDTSLDVGVDSRHHFPEP